MFPHSIDFCLCGAFDVNVVSAFSVVLRRLEGPFYLIADVLSEAKVPPGRRCDAASVFSGCSRQWSAVCYSDAATSKLAVVLVAGESSAPLLPNRLLSWQYIWAGTSVRLCGPTRCEAEWCVWWIELRQPGQGPLRAPSSWRRYSSGIFYSYCKNSIIGFVYYSVHLE